VSTALVTDSTCDLPKEVLDGIDVTVVPLYILFGEESFRQDVELDTDTFYRKQRETLDAGGLPHTSQPTAADFLKVYRGLLKKGHDTIVSLHISSDMSGTCQSARMARDEIREERAKEKKDADIRVIDSRTVSVGLGRLVVEADRLLKAGTGPDELVKTLDDLIAKVRIIFYVGSLEYLHKGGRIGTARALLGALLSLKLILQVKDGLVRPLAKVRKKAKLFEKMVQIMMKETSGGEVSGEIGVAHGDARGDYDALLAVMPDDLKDRIVPARIGGVVGCHAGPEVVGVAYLPG
jgi:DegV family protein with EDD domain